MKYRITTLMATSATAALLCAGAAWADSAPASPPAAPAPAPMPYPAMSATLSANPAPATFDAGPLGKIQVGGVLSGGGFVQSNPTYSAFGLNKSGYGDLDNAMVIVNKSDGPIQFYVQAGAYTIQALGAGYYKTGELDQNLYGYVPQGFVKIVPDSHWSIMAGALPTLIGDEYTFSFENYNIERGLLWGQEPAVSKGVQVNYASGPFSVSVAYTDGYYSDTYTAVSGLISYTFKNSDVLAFAGEGNVSTNHHVSSNFLATPFQQNQGQIYNLIYTHTQGPWTISPYLQYNSSPHNKYGSLSGETYGAAILTKYSFTPEFNLAGRVEYIKSSGPANLLGYGEGSSAWSITLTPTFQKGIFFARLEGSYVGISHYSFGFGKFADKDNQIRGAIETGVVF